MSAPRYTAADYAAALHALLPRGRVWPREPGSVQAKTLLGLAPTYERSNGRSNDLLVDAFPATAYELLHEWELTLGLPGIYGTNPTTIEDRQHQVVAALTDTGGQSVAYFIALAKSLGYDITIKQFTRFSVRSSVAMPVNREDWGHVWMVNVPGVTIRSFDVNSGVDEPLASWDNVALLQVLHKYKPAHSILLFTYL